MAKKLISGPILASLVQIWAPKFFLWVLPWQHVRHCYKLSLRVISRKTKEANLRKWQRPDFGQIRATKFFFKILALSVTRYHGQLLSCTISEKTKYSILRKVSDRRSDRQTRVIS